MDTLSRELFDLVLEHLAVYDFPFSARFAVLDDASRQTILVARQVARCFRDSKAVENLYVTVLEETPFRWYGNQMPRLVEVSRSSWAARMSTLSLCGMKFDASDTGEKTMLGSGHSLTTPPRTDLASVLRRFARVKYLRYYVISPNVFREVFWGHKSVWNVGPAPQWGYPLDDENVHSWSVLQQNASWICGHTLNDVVKADLPLESMTFPLFGNRTSYCAIQVTQDFFHAALKRLSISLTRRFEDIPLFEPWLKNLRNLIFLEVAVCEHPLYLMPRGPFASCQQLTGLEAPTSRDQLPRLEEFRLMSDNQVCFSERGIFSALALFPKLQKLGLAHILIKSELNNANSWESLLTRLVPKALNRLWLLDPRNLWFEGTSQDGHNVMEKYKVGYGFRAAARHVRLIDTNSLWTKDSEPPRRRDFDYPGFAIFEQVPEEPL